MKALIRLTFLTAVCCLLPSAADAFNRYASPFPLRVTNSNYLRITNDEATTKRARCIAVITASGTAADIGKVAITDLNITTGATGDCQPASGVEWLIHAVVHEGDITLGHYDGTNLVNFDSNPENPTTEEVYQIDATCQPAPSTPSAGKGSIYCDSTSKNLAIKDDAGVVKHGVQTTTSTSGQFVTSIDADGTVNKAAVQSASDTLAGISELAIASEVNTGTDATRAITPDALAGSNFGRQVVQVDFGAATALATGDGKAYVPITAKLNGMNLVAVSAHVVTVSSSGAVTVDLARCATVATGNQCSGTVVDMLSTNLTIDANENKSSTAAAAVIDATNDDVATDQVIRIDVDAAGTGTAGLIVTMEFQLP